MVVPPWTRKEVIGDCTLYQGDMRQVLPALDEKAVLCVTDPPYLLTSGGSGNQSMSGKFSSDRYKNTGDLMAVLPWGEMGGPIYRALVNNADAYIMCNDKHVGSAQIAFEGVGFKFHNLLPWYKRFAVRNQFYMKDTEFTQYLWKGRAQRPRYGGSTQTFVCHPPRGFDDHPTAKPTALMAYYILNSSDPGQLVLEPFAGSGTTILAALAFGRRAIGVEIDPAYFDLTCERIHAAYADGFKEIRADWERWRIENRIKGLAYAA